MYVSMINQDHPRREGGILLSSVRLCVCLSVWLSVNMITIGVGDGGAGSARASPPQKKMGRYFSGNNYVKFGHFSGKNTHRRRRRRRDSTVEFSRIVVGGVNRIRN